MGSVFESTIGIASTPLQTMAQEQARLPVWNSESWFTVRTCLDKKPRHVEMGLIRANDGVFKGEGDQVLCCEHFQTTSFKKPADCVGKTEKIS